MKIPSFVVITPARNEAQFIELTINSVIAQTARPSKWVIVNDGSTDNTEDIVQKYLPDHPWIELVNMPGRKERDFAGKVFAFRVGYACCENLDFDVVVSLDADVSFEPEYFSFLLRKLSKDDQLGLVGTPFQESTGRIYDYRFVSIEHVSGICQMFRRRCFESIGGYVAVKGGSIDHIAVISARMKGWKTRTFAEMACVHHRKMGTADRGILASRFKTGIKDYCLGSHPLWEACRVTYQMTRSPRFLGGAALGAGYLWALIRRAPRPVTPELIRFHRHEQMQRLSRFLRGNAQSLATR